MKTKKLEEKLEKQKNKKLMKKKEKKVYLQAKKRYLKKIFGNSERPRISVFRSHKNIYAQIIDDQKGYTFCATSTLSKELKNLNESTATKEASFKVGKMLGELAQQKNIQTVIFDCGKKAYHGRIKSLAEGARSAGLLF